MGELLLLVNLIGASAVRGEGGGQFLQGSHLLVHSLCVVLCSMVGRVGRSLESSELQTQTEGFNFNLVER